MVGKVRTGLEARLGRSPSDQEVAFAAEIPIADVAAVRLVAAHPTKEIEWNCIPDDEAYSRAELVEMSDVHDCLQAALDRLPANQSLALRRYYLEEATLDDIATELGVSRERARQVRKAGEQKLRRDLLVLALWQAFFCRT